MEAVPGRRRVSIYDVATLAGVSSATVSRALSGSGAVAAGTRNRVRRAADSLGYAPSPQAVGLASGRTNAVGVIVPFLTRWFFGAVVDAVVGVVREHGYDVVLHHLGSAAERDRFFARMPLSGRVDGVLTCSMPLTEEHTLALRALGLPYVGIGPQLPGHASVGVDETRVATLAVQHLVNLGHRRIGYLEGQPDDPGFRFAASALRRTGFEDAVRRAGLPLDPAWRAWGRYGVDGGIRAMTEVLAGSSVPTAIVCEYDELAFGALAALRRAGLAAPRDVSLVGIDDHEMAGVLDLTSVHQDVHGQGELAARLLMAQLAGSTAADEHVLPTRLVLRGTTGPPSG